MANLGNIDKANVINRRAKPAPKLSAAERI
jgi:hypothetical protein